jgi:hypothetical protein
MHFDVDLEIHAPGLNLHHERWNHHVLFMDEVHRHARELARFARSRYESGGRGSVFIDPDQWMEIIEGGWEKRSTTLPCSYIAASQTWPGTYRGRLGRGHEQMMAEYDPNDQFVLTVLHHPGELLSAYLLRFPTALTDL